MEIARISLGYIFSVAFWPEGKRRVVGAQGRSSGLDTFPRPLHWIPPNDRQLHLGASYWLNLLAFLFHFFMFVGPRRSALEASSFPSISQKLDPSALVVLDQQGDISYLRSGDMNELYMTCMDTGT
jgi:hypothetical protein